MSRNQNISPTPSAQIDISLESAHFEDLFNISHSYEKLKAILKMLLNGHKNHNTHINSILNKIN